MNEFDFIRQLREQIRSRQQSSRLSVGIGDDAAVIRQYSDRDFVLTTDLLVEGIDFHPQATSPQLLGHKALAVSLSDVAAMGARPRWALLSVGFCKDRWQSNFKDELFAGYLDLADRYGVTLAGGDVSAAQQIVIDSILVGEVTSGRAVVRSGARPGDQIFVTGSLGGAAAGLKLIELGARVRSPSVSEGNVSQQAADGRPQEDSDDDDAIQALLLRQLSPQPRVGWGLVLGEEQLATSMIDVSDGLSSDLRHLCDESKVGAVVDAASLPLDENAVQLCGRRALDPLGLALHGGEDFELLFTVAPENVVRLPRFVDGIPISHIGAVTSHTAIRIREQTHEWDLEPEGFQHFSD